MSKPVNTNDSYSVGSVDQPGSFIAPTGNENCACLANIANSKHPWNLNKVSGSSSVNIRSGDVIQLFTGGNYLTASGTSVVVGTQSQSSSTQWIIEFDDGPNLSEGEPFRLRSVGWDNYALSCKVFSDDRKTLTTLAPTNVNDPGANVNWSFN